MTLPISSRRSQTQTDANGETRRTPRRTRLWLAAFFGFFAMSMAWSFATPYDGFADELRHVARAYTVAGGEFVYDGPTTDGAWLAVPKSLSPRTSKLSKTDYTSCFNWNSSKNASCAVPPGREADKHTTVLVPSGAAQYNPIYYAMVGVPLRWWPDYRGIYAARALSAAYNCALIAFCVTACAGVRRGRILLSGMLVALTPVVINFTAGINPAGIEMTAGLAFWTAGILLAVRRRTTPGLLALGAVGAAILATVRGGGLLWLALNLAVLVFLVPVRRWWPTAKRLWRERAVRWWTAFVALAVVGAVGWTVSQNPNGGALVANQPSHHSFARMTVDSLSANIWGRSEFLVNGVVGLAGFSDTWPPGFLWSIWFMSFGVVIFGALAFSPWRGRLQMLALILGSTAVTLAADIVPMSQGQTLSQGRYVIPVLVGVPLLGAWFLYRSGVLDLPRNRTLTRAYAVVLLPLQMAVLYVSMLRYQRGLSQPFPINPFKGQWLPPSGPYLPFFLAIAALAVIGAVFWRVSGENEDEDEADPAVSPAMVPAPAGAAD